VHRCELGEVVECMYCHSHVALGQDCVYAVTENAVLCFHCTVSRGGVYEDSERTWKRLPDLSELQRDAAAARKPRRHWGLEAAEHPET
jgi:hypothetical protein